ADRVADSLAQEDPEPNRAADAAGLDRTRLGHAEVDRVRTRRGELAVGHDVRPHVGGLQRDLDVAGSVVELLEDLAVAQRNFDHAVRRALAVVTVDVVLLTQGLVDLFRQRSRVDSDAERYLALLGCFDDLLDFLAVRDVAGVEAKAVHTG